MTITLISPDALSVRLFCTHIVRQFLRIPGARVIVVSDVGEHEAELREIGAESIPVPFARFTAPFSDVRLIWRLYRILKRERADFVFNLSTKPNLYGTIAARLAGVPEIVSYVVGLGVAFLPERGLRQWVLHTMAVALYRLSGRWSTRFWFTNPSDLALFVESGIVDPWKCVLTRFYVDVDAYSPDVVPSERVAVLRQELGLSAGDPVVLMVARMIWPKGIREFAEAAELLSDRFPRARFLLVAPLQPGSSQAVPESYIRGKETTANLTWLGFRHDVKTFYALADVAVLPSYYREGGYPRALTEPMAMGKPLVTTTNDDCRAPVEDGRNGFIVPIKDSPALADAIARLIEQPELRRTFGRYSREKALREYDEARVVAEAFDKLGFERFGWQKEQRSAEFSLSGSSS
jgi:N,N'-diacetylbacillosaminyl-diphospho-undecaprenol alpha-1,3-N-acetylgalactosaminyltransferase